MRIISLVPSITELLYDLGLEKEVVGITKFCIHPERWRQEKSIIGGTKNINIDKIKSLNPDLIIANKEENVKEQILECQEFCKVIVTDVNDFSSAISMIGDLGLATGTQAKAQKIIDEIIHNFSNINIQKRSSAIYLIWKNPYMSVGGDNFINSMMKRAGYDNLLIEASRYPTITIGEIKNLSPEYLLLSTEPYPFKEEDVAYFEKLLPHTKLRIVDGTYFSWYGSRMISTPAYLRSIQ